jgi:hypothetical protein
MWWTVLMPKGRARNLVLPRRMLPWKFCSSGAKRSVHQPHSMLLALLQNQRLAQAVAGAE